MKIRLLLPTILAGVLSSCIGGGVMRKRERPLEAFNIEKKVRVIHGGNLGRNPTGKEITRAWGQPDRAETFGRETVWTYDTRKASQGAVVFGILPVPVVTPGNPDGIDFHFHGAAKTPWKAVERTTSISGGYVDLTGGRNGSSYHKLGE